MFMSAPFRRVRLGKESRKGKRGRTFHAFLYGFHRSYSLYDLISEKDMPRLLTAAASSWIYSFFIKTMLTQLKGM